ncbi:transmembrane protein [Apis mellifera carnica]|uniref:Transmembrane protein 138 n=1 Tax=Apis mellifera TaxID=7460 RepID=A0A7M7GN39_APIME|nr:transmembrane protein 138 isoform X1 [Apis mellifera]KAG9432437.1 transmembrane protein [Apis mellifera carnica]|eukprot:XP_006560670.1 transmembrane protein 138 isoform X1 [Apis mellifera]
MNTINTKRYLVIIIIQYLILLFDIFVNSFTSFSRSNSINLLILYVAQDICIVMTITLLLVNFFSTYIFQIGLIQLLYTKFRITLILCIIYMVLSITLHIWDIKLHWSSPFKYYWTTNFHILYSLHRGVTLKLQFYTIISIRGHLFESQIQDSMKIQHGFKANLFFHN